MPLRIVIDIRHIRNFGIGTYIRNLVGALAKADRENCYVLASDTTDLPELSDLPSNFETAVYHPARRKFWDSVAYAYFLRSLAPDLIHLPVNQGPVWTPRPYVVTVHDMSDFLYGAPKDPRENYRLYWYRRRLLGASRILAVSEATKRDVENLLKIPQDRVQTIYGAPDPRFFSEPSISEEEHLAEKRNLLERYQIQYPFVLYAGRIKQHKNVPKLIEAFAVVSDELAGHPQYRDLRLIIIGDEISRNPEVRRAVIQTRKQHVVRFLGFVPFDTLRFFYSAASVFAFPSLYEGFGLPPLEAMATGTPVVTSGVSSLPEVVGDAAMIVKPEIVFDIARGIREVLLDEALRQRLVAAGYVQARRFDWLRTAAETLDVYKKAARQR